MKDINQTFKKLIADIEVRKELENIVRTEKKVLTIEKTVPNKSEELQDLIQVETWNKTSNLPIICFVIALRIDEDHLCGFSFCFSFAINTKIEFLSKSRVG